MSLYSKTIACSFHPSSGPSHDKEHSDNVTPSMELLVCFFIWAYGLISIQARQCFRTIHCSDFLTLCSRLVLRTRTGHGILGLLKNAKLMLIRLGTSTTINRRFHPIEASLLAWGGHPLRIQMLLCSPAYSPRAKLWVYLLRVRSK